MIEEWDVYLDINHEFKFPDVLEWVQEARYQMKRDFYHHGKL